MISAVAFFVLAIATLVRNVPVSPWVAGLYALIIAIDSFIDFWHQRNYH